MSDSGRTIGDCKHGRGRTREWCVDCLRDALLILQAGYNHSQERIAELVHTLNGLAVAADTAELLLRKEYEAEATSLRDKVTKAKTVVANGRRGTL